MDLTRRRAWIFDLDGTLTVAVHDFDAIRAELDLPAGEPILEALAALPAAEAAPRAARLHELERELALQGRAAPGAAALLQTLSERGLHLGVLTRNSTELALLTLGACGLAQHFEPAHVLGREAAPPKPDPAGIQRLLEAFGVGGHEAVMVGDYLFDLQAGRAAGAATVWLDHGGDGRFARHGDLSVPDLDVLAAALGS